MSIIVDLYNLHLKENPKEDKQKISNFLKTYAPEIFKYETAEDFSPRLKRDEKTGSYIPDNNQEFFETLGGYELLSYKRSWLDTRLDDFYAIYNPTRRIADKFLNSKQGISKEDALWVNDLLEYTRLTLAITEDKKEIITFNRFPESIEPKKYNFEMIPIFRSSVINNNMNKPLWERLEWIFPKIKYQLFWEFISLWNNNLNLKRCAFPGSKKKTICNNIFIQAAERHRFCSEECRLEYHSSRKAEYMREKRNPNSPFFDEKYVYRKKD